MNADIEVFFLPFSEMLMTRTDYRAKIAVRETTHILFSIKTACVFICAFEICFGVLWSPTGMAGGLGQIPCWAPLPPAQTGSPVLNWEVFSRSEDGRICPKIRIRAACKPVGLDDTGLGTVSVNSSQKEITSSLSLPSAHPAARTESQTPSMAGVGGDLCGANKTFFPKGDLG